MEIDRRRSKMKLADPTRARRFRIRDRSAGGGALTDLIPFFHPRIRKEAPWTGRQQQTRRGANRAGLGQEDASRNTSVNMRPTSRKNRT